MATIWPTLPDRGQQGIIARHDPARGTGFALFVDARGAGALVGNGRGGVHGARREALPGASLVPRVGVLRRGRAHADRRPGAPRAARPADDAGVAAAVLDGAPALDSGTPLLVAALGGAPVAGHYNGKIGACGLRRCARPAKLAEPGGAPGRHLVALWDFARDTSSTRAVDVGAERAGRQAGEPAGARHEGSRWTGDEMCWRHAPDEYGAIHFHDDDLYDCGWATDFTYTVPDELRSGVYAMRLAAGDVEEMIPFFVRPPRGQRRLTLRLHPDLHLHRLRQHHARGTTDAYRARVPRGARGRGRPTSTGVRPLDLQLPHRRERDRLLLAAPPRSEPAVGLPRLRRPARLGGAPLPGRHSSPRLARGRGATATTS